MCFPEYYASTALFEWRLACKSRSAMHGLKKTNWTLTHSFFANSGGLVLEFQELDLPLDSYNPEPHSQTTETPSESLPMLPLLRSPGGEDLESLPNNLPVTADGLRILLEHGVIELPDLSEMSNEIKDKSKQNWFAKLIVLTQSTSFIVGCVVRLKISRLTITPLEYITGMLVLVSLIAVFSQWYKPRDVERPIRIPCRQLPKLGPKIIEELTETYVPYLGRRPANLADIKRIPLGYLSRSQFHHNFGAWPCSILTWVNSGINILSWRITDHFFIGYPWRRMWVYAAFITGIIPLVVFIGLMVRITVHRIVPGFYKTYGVRFYKFLDFGGFILGLVYGACRLTFYVVGISTLFANNLPMSAYKTVEWGDKMPSFQGGIS